MHLLAPRTLYMAAMAAVMLAVGASAYHDRNRYYEIRDNTSIDRTNPVCAVQQLDVEVKCSSGSTWTVIGESPLHVTCGETDNGLEYRDTRDTDFTWRVDWVCDVDPPGAYTADDVSRYITQVTITGGLECVYATPRLAAQTECEYDIHE